MWDLFVSTLSAFAGIPWWFYLFAVLALVQKPLVKIVKRFWNGGIH